MVKWFQLESLNTNKYCGVCETTKSVEEFSKKRTTKDGLQSHCKSCQKFYRDNKYIEKEYGFKNNDEFKPLNLKKKPIKKVTISYYNLSGNFRKSNLLFYTEEKYDLWYEKWNVNFTTKKYVLVDIEIRILKHD